MKLYIWILFAIIFAILATHHFHQAGQKINYFTNKGKVKTFNGIPLGVGEFIEDFNKYIAELNKNNRRINIIAGFGYIVASLTAIFSFYLSIF